MGLGSLALLLFIIVVHMRLSFSLAGRSDLQTGPAKRTLLTCILSLNKRT